MTPWAIYTLSDPRAPDDVRYVGKTGGTPKARLSAHLTYARGRGANSTTHLVNWLKLLIAANLVPQIRVIEQGTGDWEVAERSWIRWHREQGYNLCNATDGGEGASPGRSTSAETRAKLSAANKGKVLSAETRSKMSAARKGRGPVLTPESYEKMSRTKTGRPGPKQTHERIAQRVAAIKLTWEQKKAAGWVAPPSNPDAIAKTAAFNKGKARTEETKAKISAANKGRVYSQEIRASMSAGSLAVQKSRGEKNPHAKLTRAQVDEIRAATGSLKELAKRLGISYQTVWRIRTGKAWTP